MARLPHGLRRMPCGRPKLRLKRIVQMAEREKCKDGMIADEEHVVHGPEDDRGSAAEDELESNTQPSENVMLSMESIEAMEEKEESCLLPGLPNEVVVDFILAKLPWTTLYVVSSLNHKWRDVFRKREVYDARVRTNTVEKLVVMTHAYPDPNDRVFQGVSLYDPTQNAWRLLPPLPRVKGGITSKYECAIVKGKVYVIGGLSIDEAAVSWKAVLTLDLGACRGVWAKCSDMKISRSQFALQVKDDKIFIFGGVDEEDHMLDEVHVYEPEHDSWSAVDSMRYKRCSHKAIGLDGFFYLCGGNFWVDDLGDRSDAGDQTAVSNRQHVWNSSRAQDASFMEMYDERKGVWVMGENLTQGRGPGSYFVVDGVLHHLNRKVIEVYDKLSNSWQSFCLEPWSHAGDTAVCAAEVVEDEIFALVLERRDSVSPSRGDWALMARCNIVAVPVKAAWGGLGSNHLTWERMKCPLDFNWSSCSIHRLLL